MTALQEQSPDLTANFPGVIDYERPNTWPPHLTELFDARRTLLADYEGERNSIDLIYRDDVAARLNPPTNRFLEERDQVVEQANEILAGKNFLGFHCTRLADDELSDICASGLRLLSSDFLRERIERRVQAGDIPGPVGAQLLEINQAAEPYRKGRLAFVGMRSVLTSEDDIVRLLQSWGGEALYWGCENDSEIGPLLRRIGTPRILVVSLPISRVKTFHLSVGNAFIAAYLAPRGISTGNAAHIQCELLEPLPPERIIGVACHGDPDFESLTRCTTWEAPSFAESASE